MIDCQTQPEARVSGPTEAFTGWSKTFTDPRLCAAIVDRLTFNATLIETGTEFYRLAGTNANETDRTRRADWGAGNVLGSANAGPHNPRVVSSARRIASCG